MRVVDDYTDTMGHAGAILIEPISGMMFGATDPCGDGIDAGYWFIQQQIEAGSHIDGLSSLLPLAINEFIAFYRSNIDTEADIFLIDPDRNNPKALRAYRNAGFISAGQFLAGSGTFEGQETVLMTKKMPNY